MLKETNKDKVMTKHGKKLKLTIHRSNLYHPSLFTITKIVRSLFQELVAVIRVRRKSSSCENVDWAPTLIELHDAKDGESSYLSQTFYVYETITGLAWLDAHTLLTVSREKNINIYDIRTGLMVFTIVTDYGSITSLKYCSKQNALFTGTELGYVVCYKVDVKKRRVELVNKMVKTDFEISAIDLAMSLKDDVPAKTLTSPISDGAKSKKSKEFKLSVKRKRSDTSDESDSDEANYPDLPEFLSEFHVMIYGAASGSIVVWDYHRKTILDTIRVCDGTITAMVSLSNGDITCGDSTGTFSIFDRNTLTCRQSTNLFKDEIVHISKDVQDKSILVSGHEPTIMVMKQNEAKNNEFALFEKLTSKTHEITCTEFMNMRRFVVGSLDGFLAIYKLKTANEITMDRSSVMTNFSDKIRFSDDEMLVQHEKNLVLWKLAKPVSASPKKIGLSSERPEPVKHVLLKARAYIHASTFCDKWICYATKRDVYLFSRDKDKLEAFRPMNKLPGCHSLELCFDNRYLAVSSANRIYMIDLTKKNKAKKDQTEGSVSGEKKEESIKLEIASEYDMKKYVRSMTYIDQMDTMFVSCGNLNNLLIMLKPSDKSDESPEITGKLNTVFSFLHIAHNVSNRRDYNLYLFTPDHKLLKFDPRSETKEILEKKFKDAQTIAKLSKYANIIGLVVVSKDYCVLYDSQSLYKVDMNTNEVVNTNVDYNYILKLGSPIFSKSDNLALAELTPDDLMKSLPARKFLLSKFGN